MLRRMRGGPQTPFAARIAANHMLFSLTKKFIFIANQKTASTAIEKVLAPHADLRLLRAEFGKHLAFKRVIEHFGWLTTRVALKDIFVFGVIRDPVDYIVSMYNAHTKERFRGIGNLYTGEMSFEQFLSVWAANHPDHVRPQISRFKSADGELAANFLISFDRLQEGLEVVAKRIQVPALANLPLENQSPQKISRGDLTPRQIIWIENHMLGDADAIRHDCNRFRVPEAARTGEE